MPPRVRVCKKGVTMQRFSKNGALMLLAAVLAAGGSMAASAQLVETSTIEESVPVDGDAQLLVVVENVFGSVHVTAHDRPSVDMTATETIRAETESDLERARAETGLRTEQGGGRIAFLDRRSDDGCDCRWRRWDGYVAEYDIVLRVPRDASLDVSTVNAGEMVVDGVLGDFEVANVNGPVRLRGLRGTGRVTTVNGRIDASFAGAPAGATSFQSVNGRIEVAFPQDLSADLEFKTMHGEIWTDFDAQPLSLPPVRERTQDGGTSVVRIERRSAIRVASGGPTHSFETLNGDIYVRQAGR